jgi:prepilin-type N-terminal cleavage/methylation domain-containing protein
MLKNKKGFTLIEVIVILAVIAVLAAVLTPMITSYLRDAKLRRAESDTKMIAAAVQACAKDLADWPIWKDGRKRKATDAVFYALYSKDGDKPATGSGVSIPSTMDTIENQLVDNKPSGSSSRAYPTTGTRKWMGPYLEKVSEDPWGNKYYVDVRGLWPANVSGMMPVFVVSAGPNKKLETKFAQRGPSITIGGDDIVHRIK